MKLSELIPTNIPQLYIIRATGEFFSSQVGNQKITDSYNPNNIAIINADEDERNYFTIPKRDLYLQFAPEFITIPAQRLEYYLTLKEYNITPIDEQEYYPTEFSNMFINSSGQIISSTSKEFSFTTTKMKHPYHNCPFLKPSNGTVSRLIADTFLKKPAEDYIHLYHIDLNCLNNSIENLLWVPSINKEYTDWKYFKGKNHSYISKSKYVANEPSSTEYISAFALKGEVIEKLVLEEFCKFKKTDIAVKSKYIFTDFNTYFFSLYPQYLKLKPQHSISPA